MSSFPTAVLGAGAINCNTGTLFQEGRGQARQQLVPCLKWRPPWGIGLCCCLRVWRLQSPFPSQGWGPALPLQSIRRSPFLPMLLDSSMARLARVSLWAAAQARKAISYWGKFTALQRNLLYCFFSPMPFLCSTAVPLGSSCIDDFALSFQNGVVY